MVGHGSYFRQVGGFFVNFLGFGRKRERSRCRGAQFFFPCLCTSRGRRRTHSVVPNSIILGFFLTVDETATFFPKHTISFQSSICDLFNLVPDSINYRPSLYASFPVWSLVLDFFNQVLHWQSNFNIYAIKTKSTLKNYNSTSEL
jgi:hypothetical protein